VTTRQFRAVVTGNKIHAGVPVDYRCVDEIVRLYGEAQNLDKSAPNATEKAKDIMASFEGCLNRMRSDAVRKRYDGFRSRFVKMLNPYLK
jgi:hypothetical protein